MGIWAEQVVPRILARVGSEPLVRRFRAEACRDLRGVVVEVGFGAGHNLPFYPSAVTRAIAIEPSDVAWQLAADRIAAAPFPVERGGLDGQRLDLPDASVDSALSTLTLCTIPDAQRALAEVIRVLRPGGTLHFFEHGLADDEGVQRWQRRLEPLQKRICDGCHLTRPIDVMVAESGLVIERIERELLPVPRISAPWSFGYVGVARKAGQY